MRLIQLTRGKCATVDEEEYDRLMQHNWHAHWANENKRWDACRTVWVYAIQTRRYQAVTVSMAEALIGKRPGYQVDHKNRNTLDNRRGNLRHATATQNAQNRRRHNALDCKGVTQKRNRFQARIMVNGEARFLGSYKTVGEAAKAYNDAAARYFGPFASFNKYYKGGS